MNRRRLLLTTSPALLAATFVPGLLQAQEAFSPEGRYQVISPPQPTETGDKVEILDVFWYGCPHCFTFLPHMEAWAENKPPFVEVRRMPAIFRDDWEAHARAYYVALLLGVADRIHQPLFEAIHRLGQPLNTQDSLRAFFATQQVAADEFDKTWASFGVDSLVRKSKVMQGKYGVRGTPSVVINGKYITSGSLAGSHENVLKVMDALSAREHSKVV